MKLRFIASLFKVKPQEVAEQEELKFEISTTSSPGMSSLLWGGGLANALLSSSMQSNSLLVVPAATPGVLPGAGAMLPQGCSQLAVE